MLKHLPEKALKKIRKIFPFSEKAVVLSGNYDRRIHGVTNDVTQRTGDNETITSTKEFLNLQPKSKINLSIEYP